MARRTRPTGPTPVDSITHGDKRTNIPTADAHAFVDPAIEEVRKVRYARDESLDPQLVWRGKYPPADEIDDADLDLLTDAPPIYIQEKIDPRVLIENLRRTAGDLEDEPELKLFESFDGLGGLDQVDFYKHDANWSNRMVLGDSLQVMASLAEREKLRGKVQMVYIDPPYGIRFNSNWQASTRKRDVRDGKLEDAAREPEQIKAFRDTWELGIHSYLSYLRDRLMAARDLLADSGSCFLQIGDENLHLVRNLMDEVFGSENFVSQITFRKTTSMSSPTARTNSLANTADYAIWYAKSIDRLKYRQLYLRKTLQDAGGDHYRIVELANGDRRPMTKHESAGLEPLPDGARAVRADNLISQGHSDALSAPFDFDGVSYTPAKGSHWKTTAAGLKGLALAGRLQATGRTLSYKRYFDDFPVMARTNVWTDIGADPDKTYVVQTATAVVARCMLMCTDPGDLVLDPTCGSGTTAFVAEQWGRRWITIETSRVALALARQRLMGSRFPWYLLADSAEGQEKEQSLTANALPRPSITNDDIRQGFVYDRVQHVTLRSIANNPDVKEGMTSEQIDAAIKRHADFEILYDRPFEDTKKVRVAGPFTVESLSPHRSLSFGDVPETIGETEAAKDADAPNFEQSILDNLAKAGIQNGRRQERIAFATFEAYAGEYIQAIGQRDGDADGDAPSRVAIAIGPQYGTVSPSYVKKAAREAIASEDVDLLAILGFAFDPQVTGLTEDDGVSIEASDEGFASVAGVRKLGRIPVLMVRMNADLLMGEELKKTGAGNLFTVFGEPDLTWDETEEGIVVDLRGVDVYDPTSGEIRSNSTDQIALWMIDTDYDEESFFVRHCYFTGGNDPYRRLKTALKADIDEEAWESLYLTVSRPFPRPETGKFAVKVINDYGDEVMKVFEV
jgi:adenine-specific DNA-methyltransferase